MHIGIDAHAIGAKQGGNETYIRNLIKAIAEIDGENQYTLYLADRATAREWREGFAQEYRNFRIRLMPKPTPLVRVPVALAFELRIRPVDILHVQFTAPPFCPVPVVATIHDLAFEHMPETFTRRGSLQLKLTVRSTARKAAGILTVSDYSRQDIIRTYKLPPEKIVVTHNGIESHFTPTPPIEDESKEIRARYGISQKFILAVGSLQPRKNLVRLIRAYSELRNRNTGFNHQLVIVGRKLWLADSIFDEVKNQKWADDVIITGYINDSDLAAFYRAADLFVYPSLFEGFGLPPVEAMACGTPVITSNTTCFPEVTGNAAIMIDPYNERELADAILRVANDKNLRDSLREKGIIQAKRFSWNDAAIKTLKMYRDSQRLS